MTLDQIYEVQHTALDADVQASMARVLGQCADDTSGLMVRAAKAVALLELIQDTVPTDAKLVAQCLYDRVDRGNHGAAVTGALDELRRRNLLGYSEKHGYKVQSSAGEEWDRERRDIGVAREVISEIVQQGLTWLLGTPERPRLQGRPFPWEAMFSDGRRADDVTLVDSRDDASVLRRLPLPGARGADREHLGAAQRRVAARDRLVWLAGDSDQVDQLARDLHRSRAMVRKYEPRRESLSAARRLLLPAGERTTSRTSRRRCARPSPPRGWPARCTSAAAASPRRSRAPPLPSTVRAAATRVLPDLFPHFVATQVLPGGAAAAHRKRTCRVLRRSSCPASSASSISTRGRYVPSCSGIVPRRVQEYIETEGGLGGATLLAHFGGPPYGYTANVVKACVAGLLRAGKVRLQPDGGNEITAIRDAGVRDLFEQGSRLPARHHLPGW